MAVHLFGIRHHGAGSAKRLRKALEALQPDLLLIEGPADAVEQLPYAAEAGMQPPVALLLFNPKDLKQAAYYPYTEFSPEWQALQYAFQAEIPVEHFDLPQAIKFEINEEIILNEEKIKSDKQLEDIVQDPLGYMASLAGYTDSERWWEVMFEQHDDEVAVFEGILELMQALREELPIPERRSDLIREAYMRKVLRKSLRDGFERIAVVCGAWHTPALMDLKAYKVKDDNALLKGLSKVKTAATWIPWSYDRIARKGGYGAGISSPAWYKLLFHQRESAVQEWMIRVAQLFREEDLDASSAHVIEAVRLAETLAALRNIQLPGIEELYEAAITVFSQGDEAQMQLILDKLVVGDQLGAVPDSVPIMPLQQDLEKRTKKLRLKKELEGSWLKATKTKAKGGLDLRKEHDQKQSAFLHQLLLLGIPWGKAERPTGRELSTINEYWYLQWKPEFALQIIEAGIWGNTVPSAAEQKILHELDTVDQLPQLTALLDQSLKARLDVVVGMLLKALRKMAALTKDISHLMQALPALVQIMRYGDARQTERSLVRSVVLELLPRISIGLPAACAQVNEEESLHLFEQILSTQQAVALLQEDRPLEAWHKALLQVSSMSTANALLIGGSNRLLFDQQVLGLEELESRLRYALSGKDFQETGQWLRGFLHGSGLLLIHHDSLWKLLDEWVAELPEEIFYELLPLLRRSFSNYSEAERKRMLQRAKSKGQDESTKTAGAAWNEQRVQLLQSTLGQLLGWK